MTYTLKIPLETDRYREGWERIFGKKEEPKLEPHKCLGCFDTGRIKHHHAGYGYYYTVCPCREAPA